ncbi:MAG: TIGR02444 family protein [Hyphomicrobiales bacterium]|nr:TIGR02444 family protein [Hyphomicrobiales bacterium]
MSEPPAQGSPFWRFSIAFYRRPGVADACLALQEEAGVDVNLLLFLLWHARRCRELSQSEVAELEAQVRRWREMTVVPLRGVRRALKSPPSLVASATVETFRTRIKAIELEAERLQQEAMYDLVSTGLCGRASASSAEAARANVAAYQTISRKVFPDAAVETLLAVLNEPEGKA